jgi:hypothetical protein
VTLHRNISLLIGFCCLFSGARAQSPINSQGSHLQGWKSQWQEVPSPRPLTLEEINAQVELQTLQQNNQSLPHAPTQEEILRDIDNQRMGIQLKRDKREQQFAELYAMLGEDNVPQHDEADYNQASYKKSSGYFSDAAVELIRMLNGKQRLDLKRAVFLAENPAQENSLSYTAYCQRIAYYVTICQTLIARHKLNPKSKDAKNWAIQQLYIDTLRIRINSKLVTIPPIHYDFEDFEGRQDIRKMFVTKLLKEHSGQCHSMPLFYVILAQELGTDAFITYSPNHSYILFPYKKTIWRNFETTSGVFTTPGDIVSSGYIKNEAIENGIYLRPTKPKETVAGCLADLLICYQEQFGDDSFVRANLDTILHYYPLHAEGLLIRSCLVTSDMRTAKQRFHNPRYADLNQYPELQTKVETMKRTYDFIDKLGFADMPEEAYAAWLTSMQGYKQKTKANAKHH